MLGSKGGVKRVAVLGLGKKDTEKEGASLTPAALEAVGAQVGASAISRQTDSRKWSGRAFLPRGSVFAAERLSTCLSGMQHAKCVTGADNRVEDGSKCVFDCPPSDRHILLEQQAYALMPYCSIAL